MKTPFLKLVSLVAAVGFVTSASAQTPLLRYSFDEADSGNANAVDLGSGTAAPGVFIGAATRTANTPGNISVGALNLNTAGAGIYLSGGDADKLDGLGSFTLSLWINLQATPSGNLRLMSKQAGGSFDGFSWNIGDPVSGTRTASNFGMRLFVGGSSGFAFDPTPTQLSIDANNKWAFVAVSYDGTSSANNVNYFVGSESGNVILASTRTVNAGTVNANSSPIALGYTDAAPASDTAPPGFLDDARVYGSVLNLAQLDAVRLENLTVVPEPSTYAMLTGGCLAFVAWRRMKRK